MGLEAELEEAAEGAGLAEEGAGAQGNGGGLGESVFRGLAGFKRHAKAICREIEIR
jgi:hypothetical protein